MKDANDAFSAGRRLAELLAAADAGDIIAIRSRDGEITELALQLMDEAVQRILAAQDAADAAIVLQELFAERALLAMGVAQRARPAAVEQRLFALRQGPRGLTGAVRELQRAIRRASEVQPEVANPLAALLRGCGDDRLLKLQSPPGWLIDGRGVWKDGGDVNVARSPIVIRRIATDLERGTMRWTLMWHRDRWVSADIDRRAGVDTRGILELAGRGAPVHSGNASDLVAWLVDLEAWNLDRIPAERVTGHLGWQDDKTFLAAASDERIRVATREGETELLRGWGEQAGTWDGWCGTIGELVAPYPLALLGVYAALASVLLRPLGEDGFTVDWSGDSSGGKTTTMRVAGSVWGRPDRRNGVIRAWDSSSDVGPATVAAVLHSLPVMLDDTQHMQSARQREAVASMLYAIPAGQERLRGTQDGSVRVPRTWRTCMLTTGESAITSFAGATGARARALCLRGPPFGTGGREVVDAIRERLLDHHGHLGPKFAELVVDRGPERLRARWRELRDDYARDATDGVTARITGYVALLHMVAELCHEDLEVPGDSGAALALALAAAQQGGQDADRPLEALRDLYGWCAARLDQFDGARHGQSRPHAGWLGRWEPAWWAVYKDVAVRELAGWGYDTSNVLTSWRERGWTACSVGRTDKVVKIDGAAVRAVVVAWTPEIRALLTA